MYILAKPVNQAFVVSAEKWDAFLLHKMDSAARSRCDKICVLIENSEAKSKNRDAEDRQPSFRL